MGQISLRYQRERSGDTGNDFLGRVATVTWQDRELVWFYNMASKKELMVLAMLLLEEDDGDDSKEEKRLWARSWLIERNKKGYFHQLLPELAVHDTPSLKNSWEWIFPISKR